MRSLWVLLLVAPACGRPATEKECEQIVERIVELELKEANIVDSREVSDRVESTKKAFHQRAMEHCVGKRITDDALECVKNATASADIVSQCFE